MTIKTVHITNYYHKDSGGISAAYNKLLEAANRHGRYVRLIVPGPQAFIEEVGGFGRIYYVKAAHSPVFDKRYRLMMPWNTYMPDGSPIKTILRHEKPDLIEIGEKYTLSLMAGLLRKRFMNVTPERPVLVLSSCERMDDNVRSFIADGRISNWLVQQYIKNINIPMFDFFLANSEYTRQELMCESFSRLSRKFWRTPKIDVTDRIFVNQCGVDLSEFKISNKTADFRQTVIRKGDLPDDATLILYAGRLSPEKNIGLLPNIMERLGTEPDRQYRLIVAGDGPSFSQLARHADSVAPGKVKMLGHITDREEFAKLIANCDVFVHPNPHEPFGIAPLEAMASGLPVVVPNAGGVLSYANKQNAWLADPTPDEFASAIKNVFANDEQRNEKIASAILTAQRYSWVGSTERLFAIYDRMNELFTTNREKYDYAKIPAGVDYSK